jgi:hypothetical protein
MNTAKYSYIIRCTSPTNSVYEFRGTVDASSDEEARSVALGRAVVRLKLPDAVGTKWDEINVTRIPDETGEHPASL